MQIHHSHEKLYLFSQSTFNAHFFCVLCTVWQCTPVHIFNFITTYHSILYENNLLNLEYIFCSKSKSEKQKNSYNFTLCYLRSFLLASFKNFIMESCYMFQKLLSHTYVHTSLVLVVVYCISISSSSSKFFVYTYEF